MRQLAIAIILEANLEISSRPSGSKFLHRHIQSMRIAKWTATPRTLEDFGDKVIRAVETEKEYIGRACNDLQRSIQRAAEEMERHKVARLHERQLNTLERYANTLASQEEQVTKRSPYDLGVPFPPWFPW